MTHRNSYLGNRTNKRFVGIFNKCNKICITFVLKCNKICITLERFKKPRLLE